MPLQLKVMLVRGKPFRVSTSISVGGGGVGATGRDWAPGYSHGGSPASRGDGIPSPQQAWIVPVRCVLAATIRATTTSKTGRCGQRNGAGKVNQASGRWVEV